MIWVVISVLAAVVLAAVALLVVGTARRNRRLLAWAKSVPISPVQAEAMRALWAHRASRPPLSDPLDALSEDDAACVVRICGASFRPREFGDASVVRVASFKNFKRRGFNDRQAAVLTGMTVNMVGRPDTYSSSTLESSISSSDWRLDGEGGPRMDYGEVVAGYKAGTIRLGVDRSRIRKAVDSEFYDHLFRESEYPRMLNRLATIFSVLIIPALLAALVTPFLIVWWAFLPFAALAWVSGQMSYRYQREAIRELALANPTAYKFLLLEGIIAVGEGPRRQH